jgi:hypothetical protein
MMTAEASSLARNGSFELPAPVPLEVFNVVYPAIVPYRPKSRKGDLVKQPDLTTAATPVSSLRHPPKVLPPQTPAPSMDLPPTTPPVSVIPFQQTPESKAVRFRSPSRSPDTSETDITFASPGRAISANK